MGLATSILGNVVCDNKVVTAELAHAAHSKGCKLGATIVVEAMALRADDDQFVESIWRKIPA